MKLVTNEIKRLKHATRFSMQGMQQAWRCEAAFRFEVVLAAVLLPVACLLPVNYMERLALISTVFLVLIVELLNSAVEAVVDRVSSDHHPLSGQAKDMGSAAVFLSLWLTIITWGSIIWVSVL